MIIEDGIPFQREIRYVVIKLKDLDEEQLMNLRFTLDKDDIPTREAVVIESDWPIYEDVWQMVEDIVDPPKGNLRPCPFCGSDNISRITLSEENTQDSDNWGADVVVCNNCAASSPLEFGRKENLEDKWNTRSHR